MPQGHLELSLQLAAGLQVQGLIDRLVGHAHRLVIRMVFGQAAGDLLRRPLFGQPIGHRVVQPPVQLKLARLRPGTPSVRTILGVPSGVGVLAAVAGHFPGDRRRTAADPLGNQPE